MSEFGAFLGLAEAIAGRRLPRMASGEIDMVQIRSDLIRRDPVEKQRYEDEALLRKRLSEPGEPPRICDVVTEERYAVYKEGAKHNPRLSLGVDTTGHDTMLSDGVDVPKTDRGTPPEGYAWLVIYAEDEATFEAYDELIAPHLLRVIEQELSEAEQQPQPPQGEQDA